MFISIKKRTILIVLAVILGITAVCLIIGFGTARAAASPKNGKIIVIDAGHGGIDGGVVGVNTGVKESDINLAIARSLKHFLNKGGYEVVMTRTTTDGLYGMSTKNRKSKDMTARKQIINDAKADLVVSIHQNSFPRASERGVQVFYAPSSEEGKTMAGVMQNVLSVALNSHRIAKPGDYYILQCSESMSLLIECGFLSNPEEEKLLVSAEYQEKIAYNIFAGIEAVFFSSSTQESAAHTH